MKTLHKLLIIAIISLTCSCCIKSRTNNIEYLKLSISNGRILNFYDKDEAYQFHKTYVDSFTRLDMTLQLKNAYEELTDKQVAEKYDHFLKTNLVDWKGKEKRYLIKRLEKIIAVIDSISPEIIPDTINFIQTSGNIQYNASFTLENVISINSGLIPPSLLAWIGFIKREVELVLAHEMFHIYSRNNPQKRKELYKLIGFSEFELCELPENLKSRLLTNPDEMHVPLSYKISLLDPSSNTNEEFCLVILSKYSSYQGRKGFISYFNILMGYMESKLIKLEYDKDCYKMVTDSSNNVVEYYKDDIPEFWQKIGLPHSYTLSPEEILAQDFRFLIESKLYPKKSKYKKENYLAFFKEFENLLKNNE